MKYKLVSFKFITDLLVHTWSSTDSAVHGCSSVAEKRNSLIQIVNELKIEIVILHAMC